jgi:hypothetical protein
MSDKLQKRIIFGFLGAIVLYFAVMNFVVWNSKSPAYRDFQATHTASSEPGLSYEASYTLNGQTISVTVPAQEGDVSPETARNIAAVGILNSADQLGLTLPDHFEQDIKIVPSTEKQ